jgi:hypothetical protein
METHKRLFDVINASQAAWAAAFAAKHMNQLENRDSELESKERTAKMMGEDRYERLKKKERLNMER